jgi:hypothetical protein
MGIINGVRTPFLIGDDGPPCSKKLLDRIENLFVNKLQGCCKNIISFTIGESEIYDTSIFYLLPAILSDPILLGAIPTNLRLHRLQEDYTNFTTAFCASRIAIPIIPLVPTIPIIPGL